MHTKDTILALIDRNDLAVGRALLALFNRQTAEEQGTGATVEQNGQGFNGVDAAFGSSLAVQFRDKGSLSPRQIACGRKMLRKYAGQLAEIANAKAPAPVVAPAPDAEAAALAAAEQQRMEDEYCA